MEAISWSLRTDNSMPGWDEQDRRLMTLEIESHLGRTEGGPLSVDEVFGSDPGSDVVRASPEGVGALQRFREAARAGLSVFTEYKHAHPELLANAQVRAEVQITGWADGQRVANRRDRNRDLVQRLSMRFREMPPGWEPIEDGRWNSTLRCHGLIDGSRHRCHRADLAVINRALAWNRAFAIRDQVRDITDALSSAPDARLRFRLGAVESSSQGEAFRGGRLVAMISLYTNSPAINEASVARSVDDMRARFHQSLYH